MWPPRRARNRLGAVTATSNCKLVQMERDAFESLLLEVPQLNYELRKWRQFDSPAEVDWLLGVVPIRD